MMLLAPLELNYIKIEVIRISTKLTGKVKSVSYFIVRYNL
jgi:hypothetical protein